MAINYFKFIKPILPDKVSKVKRLNKLGLNRLVYNIKWISNLFTDLLRHLHKFLCPRWSYEFSLH